MKKSFAKSSLRLFVSLLLVLLTLVPVCGITASAQSLNDPAYDNYTYWAAPGATRPTTAAPMYELERVVTGATLGTGPISEPSDVYVDAAGLIYLVDAANGRVLVMNPDYTLKTEIKGLSYNGEGLDFTGAQGIFVTKDQKIYIADTENARVIVTNLQKQVTNILTLPKADVIPSTFSYRPSKIVIDSRGYTYIVSDGSYYGALLYMPDGTFSGFYGSNSVTSSVLDVFSRIWDMLFVSDTKKENAEKTLPYAFTDISIDKDDFVYTATGAVSTWVSNAGQLKKLSPGGTNVLKNKTGSKAVSAEGFDFSDGKGTKYATASGYYAWRVADVRSMDVDANGFMYAVCGTYGHIFIYDQECNQLSIFGGGNGAGTQKGTFNRAQALQLNQHNEDVLVVDKMNANLTVFKETEYGKLVKKAQALTNAGSYAEAKDLWNQVLAYDRNSQLAYRGLAKTFVMEEDYKSALEYAKLGFDRTTYATAYRYVRNDYISNNFVWLFLLLALVVGGLIAFLVYTNKHSVKLIKNQKVSTMFSCLTHPFDACKQVRYYGQGSVLLATIVLVLYFITSVCNDIYSGFMYGMLDKSSYSATFTFCMTIGFYLLWTLCNWAISTLFNGKGRMKEIYIVSCYSLLPLVFSNILLIILTNVVVPEEILIISVVSVVFQALFYIIMCVGIMTVQEFGFFKFLLLTAATLLGMFICLFIAFMIFVLLQQMFSFIDTIYKEVSYR